MGVGRNTARKSIDSDEPLPTLPDVTKKADGAADGKRYKNTLLYDDDIDVEVCRQKSRMLRKEKQAALNKGKRLDNSADVKYVDAHADYLDSKAQLKSLVSKRHGRLDFDFNDFRPSLIGSVSRHDFSRIQQMESIVGGIISREEIAESGASIGRQQFSPLKA